MNKFINILSKKVYSKIIAFTKAYMPKTRARLAYYVAYRRLCNINEPKTFSEKLLWLSLNTYRNNPLVLRLCDKYLVREYVIEKGYGDILNELYYVWENIEEIDFEKLPEQFALKVSQGCQNNIICSNKKDLDMSNIKSVIKEWDSGQLLYDKMMADIGGIKVKELKKFYLCEKYLKQNDKEDLIDYKIYCFNGIPKVILVIADRFNEKNGAFMTTEWTFLSELGGDYKVPRKPFKKPESLNKMIEVSKKLSEPFPFVRIDLYNISGKTIFGEMTFFPNGCVNVRETSVDGISMGELLDISKEMSDQRIKRLI